MSLKDDIAPRSIEHHYDEKLVKFVVDHENDLPHFFFWGNPGTGKTEFAHLIASHMLKECKHLNFTEFNSSIDRGIEFVRTDLKEITTSGSFDSLPKIILLDEVDNLTFDAQSALRRLMEIGKVVFILTANYPNKILPALRNRCVEWEFKGPSKEWFDKRTQFLSSVHTNALESAISSSPSSFRSVFTAYEKIVSGGICDVEDKPYLSMQPKEFIPISWTLDPSVVINKLHLEILNNKSSKKANALIELAEMDYRCSLNSNKILQIQTGFFKIWKILNERPSETECK